MTLELVEDAKGLPEVPALDEKLVEAIEKPADGKSKAARTA